MGKYKIDDAVKEDLQSKHIDDSVLEETFDLFDKNGDGFIDIAELKTMLRALKQNPTEEDLETMMAEADTITKDNKIEIGEFCGVIGKYCKTPEENSEELLNAFKVFDKDGNGTIEKTELKEILEAIGQETNQDELDDMMTAVDTNKDGKICYREFVQMMMS